MSSAIVPQGFVELWKSQGELVKPNKQKTFNLSSIDKFRIPMLLSGWKGQKLMIYIAQVPVARILLWFGIAP